MPLSDLLLPEFDVEIKNTRRTLERLPDDKPEYKPHDKSMPLLRLANHVADMPSFLSIILSSDSFDVSQPNSDKSKRPSNTAERLERFDTLAVKARAELAETADRAMHESWKLGAGEHTIFNGSRYQAVRSLFFNHMIHHRAQLGIYLRLNDCPVPSIYGPSADESSA